MIKVSQYGTIELLSSSGFFSSNYLEASCRLMYTTFSYHSMYTLKQVNPFYPNLD